MHWSVPCNYFKRETVTWTQDVELGNNVLELSFAEMRMLFGWLSTAPEEFCFRFNVKGRVRGISGQAKCLCWKDFLKKNEIYMG